MTRYAVTPRGRDLAAAGWNTARAAVLDTAHPHTITGIPCPTCKAPIGADCSGARMTGGRSHATRSDKWAAARRQAQAQSWDAAGRLLQLAAGGNRHVRPKIAAALTAAGLIEPA